MTAFIKIKIDLNIWINVCFRPKCVCGRNQIQNSQGRSKKKRKKRKYLRLGSEISSIKINLKLK